MLSCHANGNLEKYNFFIMHSKNVKYYILHSFIEKIIFRKKLSFTQ